MNKPKSKDANIYSFVECTKYMKRKFPKLVKEPADFWNQIFYYWDLQNDTYITIDQLRWKEKYQEVFDAFDKEFGTNAVYSVSW